MFEKDTYNERVDVRLLLRAILKQWKKLIIVAVAFAIVFPVFKYIMDPPKAEKAAEEKQEEIPVEPAQEDTSPKVDSPEVTELKNELNVLSANKAKLETYISEIEAQYDQLNKEKQSMDEYREKSVLLNIDPYNVLKKEVKYKINKLPGEDMSDDVLNRLVKAYVDDINEANKDINEEITFDQSVIRICSVASSGDTFTIMISAPDEKTAEKFITNADNTIEKDKENLSDTIARHEITKDDEKTYTTSDVNLRKAQDSYEGSIVASINASEDKLQSLNGSLYTINTQIRTTDTALRTALNPPATESKTETITEPEETEEENKGTTPADLVTWSVLGFIVGAVLVAIWYGFQYFLMDTIKCEDEISERYGIRVLGNLEDKEALPVIRAIIRRLTGESAKLLVVSTQGMESCELLKKEWTENADGVEIIAGGDLSKELKGVDALNDSTKVLLMEKVDISPVSGVSYEVDLIRAAGAEIIGCVVF